MFSGDNLTRKLFEDFCKSHVEKMPDTSTFFELKSILEYVPISVFDWIDVEIKKEKDEEDRKKALLELQIYDRRIKKIYNENPSFEQDPDRIIITKEGILFHGEIIDFPRVKNQEDLTFVSHNGYLFGFSQVDSKNIELKHISIGDYDIIHKFDSEGMAIVTLPNNGINGKCGYINRLGEEIIKPKFEGATPFERGYAKVSEYGRRNYFINKKGESFDKIPFTNLYNNSYEMPENVVRVEPNLTEFKNGNSVYFDRGFMLLEIIKS